MYNKGFYKDRDEEEIQQNIENEGFDPIKISNPPRYIYSPHSHPETKLLAFLSGSMEVEIEGIQYTCTKGDKVIIDGNVTHSAKVGDKGCTFFWSEKLK